MCRKWTSSLIAQFIVVAPSQLEVPFGDFPEYKEFSSSPNRFRGFCVQCGTSLIWRSGDSEAAFDLFIGTLDEEWLVPRHGKIPQEHTLAKPNGTQYWMENAIEGVTDILPGEKRFAQEGPPVSNIPEWMTSQAKPCVSLADALPYERTDETSRPVNGI